MANFTFFDLMSALRQIRPLNFRTASQNLVGVPTTVRNSSRDGRTWDISLSTGESFVWSEDNTLPPVISEVTASIRTPSRFNYFDIVAAIRSRRGLKFTTAGVVTLAIPTAIHNASRNSSVYSLESNNGQFTWTDDNSGPTVISEI